jgi:hypothetical protein
VAFQLDDLNEFLRISAALNYQLAATKHTGYDGLVATIMRDRPLHDRHASLMSGALEYLDRAYGARRRRLGTKAVLHPVRATALLSSALEDPEPLELLTELLHDKFEDIRREDFEKEEDWRKLERMFESLGDAIDPSGRWYLMERLDWLTRRSDDTYYAYIGRLARKAHNTPAVLRVKLADRLDNTLDMRVEVRDPLRGVDFFDNVFDVLFLKNHPGYTPGVPHPPRTPIKGSHRLYGLFKNAILLSIVRAERALHDDRTADALLRAICAAGIREAARIAMHIVGYHFRDVRRYRELLLDTMEYCAGGGADQVNAPGTHRLDGLFKSRFDHSDPVVREQKLEEMYQDKELMIEAALAFIVVFKTFIADPEYYIRGVSADGIKTD